MSNRHACEPQPWTYSTPDQVPDDLIGIYAFWYRRTGKCIYVGQASDQSIKKRLRQHRRRSHNKDLRLWLAGYGKLLDVCYARVEKGRINKIERRLIRRWRPEANVQHNH